MQNALIPAPLLSVDKMEGVIIPAHVTGVSQQLIMVTAGTKRASFHLAARKHNLLRDAVKVDINKDGIEAYLLAPHQLAPQAFWRDAGIPDWRMNERQLFINLSDEKTIAMRFDFFSERFPDVFKALAINPIIVNRFNETVYESPTGRALKTKQGKILYATAFPETQGRFFLATDKVSFRECAASVAVSILRGHPFQKKEMAKLYELAGIDEILEAEFREEIEAQIALRLSQPAAQAALKNSSLRANDNLPPIAEVRSGTRMMYQQYSTPFPIAAALQQALQLSSEDRVLEPCIGNGTLASYAIGSGSHVTGIELEEGRFERVKDAFKDLDVSQGDFLEKSHQLSNDFTCVIANPPFEKLDHEIKIPIGSDGTSFTTNRLEQAIAVTALQKIANGMDGRAFVILPADMINPSELSGSADRFDTYARAAFEKVSVRQLDGSLYKKMGTSFPTVMFALEGKRETLKPLEEVAREKVENIPAIKDWEALFSWAQDFGSQRVRDLAAKSVTNSSQSGSQTGKKVKPVAKTSSPEAAEVPEVDTIDPVARNGFQLPEVELFNDMEEDDLTVRYQALSQIGEPTTVVQKSLQGAILQSLRNVEAEQEQGVDEFVRSKLNMPPDVFASLFSPEQVDALALAFHRKLQGKGFLNSDLMGVGKGRMLAACAKEAYENNESVIFMTEKPALFQDFFARDIATVFGDPIETLLKDDIKLSVFNQDKAALKNENGKTIHSTKAEDLKNWKTHGIPVESNFIALSYSQFQSSSGGWKLDALENWIATQRENGRRVQLLLDESHKAAGEDSITGIRATDLVSCVEKFGGSVVYSSATGIKSGKNIRLYKKILPETGLAVTELTGIIQQNPLALQEILSMEIAREGGMISREINSLNAIREFIPLADIDDGQLSNVRETVDGAARFLSELVELGKIARRHADDTAKRMAGQVTSSGEKTKVETTSPVAQFHHYSQYLILAVKGNFWRELTLQSLAAGEKVVIALENTGESLLDGVIADQIEKGNEINGEVRMDNLPTIGDVLKRFADNAAKVRIIDGFGNKKSATLPQMLPLIDDFKQKIDDMDFSALCTFPVDRLRVDLEELGIPTDEISGRKRRIEKDSDGKWVIKPWAQKDRNLAVHKFNNGQTDVMFLNGSGATGISMHPSPLNGSDLRPRTMIKAQIQREVTAERQIEGRISRFGQVHSPRYLIPMSGFAADDRLCQLFNKHNRNLTATSNATRENKTNINDSLDLLNPVGEIVVRRYLEENKEIAAFLDLEEVREDDQVVRKLMGRLVCLPIATQERVIAELDSGFQMDIETLNARGINPLKLAQYDWKASIEAKAILVDGQDNSTNMGDRPTKLVELKYKERVLPTTFDEITATIKLNKEAWFDAQKGRIISPLEKLECEEWLHRDKNGPSYLISSDRPIDFSHPIFDYQMGRTKHDLFANSLLIESEYAANQFAKFIQEKSNVQSYDTLFTAVIGEDIKNYSTVDKNIHRAVQSALFLDSCLKHLEIGKVAALPPELCSALAQSNLGIRSLSLKDEEDNLSPPIPFIITGITPPKDNTDQLKLSEWSIRLAIPGEEGNSKISIKSLYSSYSDYLSECFNRHQPFNIASIFQRSLSIVENWHNNASNCDRLLDARWQEKAILENDSIEQRIRRLFDEAPAGELNRNRLAIMGNLFLGMKIAGTAFAEKIIFTDENNESQHALLLKAGQKNLLLNLETKANSLPHPLISADPTRKSLALMRLMGTLHDADEVIRLYNQFGSENRFIAQIVDAIGYTMGDDFSTAFRQHVNDNLPEIITKLAKSITSKAPSFILLGSEPSNLDVACEKLIGKNLINQQSIALTRDEAGESEALAILSHELGNSSVMITPCASAKDGYIPMVNFKRQNKLIKEELKDVVQYAMSSLRMITDSHRAYKLKGGALSLHPSANNRYPDATEQIIRKHIEKYEFTPTAYGGVRDLDNACRNLKREIIMNMARTKHKNIDDNQQCQEMMFHHH